VEEQPHQAVLSQVELVDQLLRLVVLKVLVGRLQQLEPAELVAASNIRIN
jgi:hypothetical protein